MSVIESYVNVCFFNIDLDFKKFVIDGEEFLVFDVVFDQFVIFGVYMCDVLFYMFGKGVYVGRRIECVSVFDIVLMIFVWFGLLIGCDLEGWVMIQVFDVVSFDGVCYIEMYGVLSDVGGQVD